jgi:hypothetical protein
MRMRWLVALVLAGVGTVGGAAPAGAECVMVTVEVHWWDEPDTYPLGQRDTCVTETPWNQFHEEHLGDDLHTQVYPGTPEGFFVQVRLAGP